VKVCAIVEDTYPQDKMDIVGERLVNKVIKVICVIDVQ
jgi:hypothetical protein